MYILLNVYFANASCPLQLQMKHYIGGNSGVNACGASHTWKHDQVQFLNRKDTITRADPIIVLLNNWMVLDHPFQFFIYDKQQDLMLFEGRLGKPEIPDIEPEAALLDAVHSAEGFWLNAFGINPIKAGEEVTTILLVVQLQLWLKILQLRRLIRPCQRHHLSLPRLSFCLWPNLLVHLVQIRLQPNLTWLSFCLIQPNLLVRLIQIHLLPNLLPHLIQVRLQPSLHSCNRNRTLQQSITTINAAINTKAKAIKIPVSTEELFLTEEFESSSIVLLESGTDGSVG